MLREERCRRTGLRHARQVEREVLLEREGHLRHLHPGREGEEPSVLEDRRRRQDGQHRHLWDQTPRRGEAAVQAREVLTNRFAASVGAIASVIALAGCGLGAGRGTSDVSLTVTRDFGSHQVGTISKGGVPGSETVMRMLERSFRIGTRYGGGFVQAINGLSGTS